MRKLIFTFLTIIFTVSIGYSQVTTLWEKSAATNTRPTWFGADLTRALAYGNNHVYVVSRTGGNFVRVFNAATGDSVGVLRTDGITGGTHLVSDVEVSSDGVIFVCNLSTNTSTSAFKVYKYTTESDSPVVAINYTGVSTARLGDKFTVTGSTSDNSIVIWAVSAATKELYKFTTTDNGVTFTPTIVSLPSLITKTSYGSASAGPLSNGDFYYNASGELIQKFQSDGTIIDSVSGGIVSSGANAIRLITTINSDEFIVTFAYGSGNENARIVKIKSGDPNLSQFVTKTNSLGSNANVGGTGDVEVRQVGPDLYNIYVLSTNNGFGAYQLDLSPARAQIIHNSADVLAGAVDIYVNGVLTLDNFAFRTATPYLDLPALETLNIGVAPSTSTSVADTLVSFPVVLNYGSTYVVFANGVLDSSIYAQNPDAKSTEFTLFVKPMARETAAASGVDLFVLHGATDAPAVDVQVRDLGGATIVDNAAYGDITNYINAPAQNLTLDLYLADGTTYVATFRAPLAGLNGQSLAVFASGFLNPSANQNGAGFGLFAALANGTVVQLPLGLSGDYYVGAPGTGPGGSNPQFATLREAFQTLNNSAFAGNCTFYITSDITETYTPAVGLGLAINPEPYTVTFKPYTGVQPVITLNYPTDLNDGPSGALVIGIPMENNIAWNDLRKTTNIIIDGSNVADGTTRDLTIQSALNAQRNAFPLTIVGDVSNMVVKNTNIYYKAQGVSTSGNLFVSAVQLRSRNYLNKNWVPRDIVFENNHISANFDGVVQSAQGYGCYQSSTPLPLDYPHNITLKNNLIEGKRRAITLYRAGSHDIVGNLIVLNQNIAANIPNEAIYAVDVDTNSVINIYDNRISKISSITNAANNGNTAISIETFGTYNIYNNMIYGFELTAANPVAYLRGIKNSSASATLNLNFNSIYMDNLADIGTGTVTYQGILLSDGTNNLGNNIVVSAEPDFASYCIYRSGTTGTVTSNYNDFYAADITNGNVGFWDAAATKSLTDWQTASSLDANSLSADPLFVSATDLHLLNTTSPVMGKGIAIAGITTDIDGELRDTIPEMGADDFPGVIPVELVSFTASLDKNNVVLKWQTVTELNSSYFSIERKVAGSEWTSIGRVTAAGSSTNPVDYRFVDEKVVGPKSFYRLKQVDFDGSYTYSKEVEVNTEMPTTFALSQNYPNPFNPTTKINYSVPFDSKVTISVYSITGELVMELVNNNVAAGSYSVDFNGSNLASGMYIYKMVAGSFVQTHKMMLMK